MARFDIGFGILEFYSPQRTITTYGKREHPEYNPNNLNHDIALLELPEWLGFNEAIQPAQLPTRGQQWDSFEGRQVLVSGFGGTASGGLANILQWVHLRVIGNGECASVYGGDVIRDITICTRGWAHGAQGTCGGDSGGPLILDDRTHIGVVSFVSGRGCEAGDPQGFVRTTQYIDWISQNTGIGIRP